MTGARRLQAMLIAVMVVAGSIALAIKPSGESRPIQVTGLFTKTIGLFPSSRVMVLGVAVGRVVSVTPIGNDVKVIMNIDRSRKIPADARATIVPISLISDRYVQLFPPYAGGATMQDGAVIGTDRTFIPAELDELLAQLKKLLDALQQGTDQGSTALGTLVTNLSNALRGVGGDLSATLAGGGKVSTTILTRSADLDGVIVHLSSLVTALAQRRNDLVDLNTHLAEALGAIAAERNSLGGTLSNVALLTDQLSSLVHDHKAALETDLQTLAKTTQAVIRHQDSLVRTLLWVPVLDDGIEGHHNGGAVDFSGPVTHLDVRDAHLNTCPPAVPAALCVLLGLEGIQVSASSPAAPPKAPPAAPSIAPAPAPGRSNAPDLLDLLRSLGLGGPSASSSPQPTPSSTPGGPIGGLLDRIGGVLDHAMRWLW